MNNNFDLTDVIIIYLVFPIIVLVLEGTRKKRNNKKQSY